MSTTPPEDAQAFESALRENPNDLAGWCAYANWLTEHGDQRIVDGWYPAAEQVTLVVDNLSTHNLAVLYEVFEPAEARWLIDRLEFVYTPKHGSWLNMAEIE